jgi:hypothetical protein
MTRWREPAPGEREAADRSWEVVRSAFEERISVPRKRDWRPAAVVAFGVALLAAAFSPPKWMSDRWATRSVTAISACARYDRSAVGARRSSRYSTESRGRPRKTLVIVGKEVSS